jgi:cephalosporin-C deacetylase-like acetyl esterase
MNIFTYLCREAVKITEKSLADLKSGDWWIKTGKDRRKKFVEMLGLEGYWSEGCGDRAPPNVKVTGVLERDDYRIEKIFFESLPKLYVAGNLYVPNGLRQPSPAVLYLCGHARDQLYHYQAHARKFAELGFITLIIETIQKGEVPGIHHGVYHYGFFHWYSLGYTPAGVEVWNAMRAIDLLQSRDDVDPHRIGVTGISGGGAISWFTAAVDERVKVSAPVCGTATIASHVVKRTVEGHCDCMFWINNYMWDLTDVGALIAPRPLLIASGERDWIFDIESVRLIYDKLKKLYSLLGAPENIMLVETPGGHAYHEISRRKIFCWFLKHLKGVDASLEDVGDVDERPEKQEPYEKLRVFDGVFPRDERVYNVHEWFIKRAEPPKIESPDDLREYRRWLKNILLEKTFTAFPKEQCDLKVEVESVRESLSWLGYRVGYTPEEPWRLHIHVIRPAKAQKPLPLLIFFARNSRNLYFGDDLLNGLNPSWARAIVEVRGVGETSWSPDFQWFIRRAAMLTGRTIASMRVYDAVRSIEALSTFSWVDKGKIALMGSGEMAAVALYAALLKEGLLAVILHDPPPTHLTPSNPDGADRAIEMLNCLKYTDLPYLAGALWPINIVFLGPRPREYAWTEEIYEKIGSPGTVTHIKSISQWNILEKID